MKKQGKRILAVKMHWDVDDSPDFSYYGEYSDKRTSEFSIDRAHEETCQSVDPGAREASDKLERVISHLNAWRIEAADAADDPEWERLDESLDLLVSLQDSLAECDCGFSGHWDAREYRYFNPSFNYVDKAGNPADGLTPADVRKYTRQDYDRMEDYNRGGWCYQGVWAEAEIALPSGTPGTGVIQRIRSGGLWGIESDSDTPYKAEEEQNQLSELRQELRSLGFGTRAISAAFRNVQAV